MKGTILFSADRRLAQRLRASSSHLKGLAMHPWPLAIPSPAPSVLVLDGDRQSAASLLKAVLACRRRRLPAIVVVSDIGSRHLQRLLRTGAAAVLFKDSPATEIVREIRRAVRERRLLHRLQETLDNEGRMRRLLNVLTTLSSDQPIDRIVNHAFAALRSLFALRGLVLFLATDTQLKAKLSIGTVDRALALRTWPLQRGRPAWLRAMMRHDAPLNVGASSPAALRRLFPTGSLLLPMSAGDRFIGLTACLPAPNRSASTADRRLIRAFIDQAALAIGNARLYWDVIRTREQMVAQERQALLGQMVLSLNHEINNPLSVISMEAQLLHKAMQTCAPPMDERLARIESSIERIRAILEQASQLDAQAATLTDYLPGRPMVNLAPHGHN